MTRHSDAQFVIARSQLLGILTSLQFFRLAILYRKYNPDQPRDDRGRWTNAGGHDVDATGSTTPIINDARTGDLEIDSITQKLLDKLADVVDALGPGSGANYGTEVHAAFAEAVRNSGIGNLEIERSFSGGGIPAIYGQAGTVRTDVLLRGYDDSSPIRAVWDVKTGVATLGPARLDLLRERLGIGLDVPIIELSVTRGVLVKALRLGVAR